MGQFLIMIMIRLIETLIPVAILVLPFCVCMPQLKLVIQHSVSQGGNKLTARGQVRIRSKRIKGSKER